ncbi:hypothetical protein [Streptacidiphilus carbonis]|jgi:hypothetical protein|uniref:hypothetical protein n=1 Tax=Streptacidiphilus carbonis TaxID=105422 RepID=UPI0005AA89C3|nr:hypothetical protein [Streptacidiphilus carbonis]
MSRTLRVRLALVVAGLSLLVFGVQGLLGEPYLMGHLLEVVFWAAGGIVLHDGAWMPLVLAAGLLFGRAAVPDRVRGALTAGLMTAIALTAVGLPAVVREHDHKGNATLLPLPYLRNWLLLLAAVVLGTAVAGAVLWWRGRTPKRAVPPRRVR